ncbi:MAG: hypothetical protein IPK26_27005 [Planctomycetes bacterium]|nr:hypothetical protein [Planctomycetota bacterium]
MPFTALALPLALLGVFLAAPATAGAQTPEPSPTARPQQYLLRLQFRPDERQFYRETLEVTGKQHELRAVLTRECRCRTAGDQWTIEQSIRRLQLTATAPEPVDYDSASDKPLHASFRQFLTPVGTTITCRRDERGRTSDRVVAGPVDADGHVRFSGSDSDNAAFGCWPELPEQPVAIDDTWTQTVEVALQPGVRLPMQVKWRLVRVERGVAWLDSVGVIDTAEVQEAMRPAAGQMKGMTGGCALDLRTGRVIRTDCRLRLQSPAGERTFVTTAEAIEPPKEPAMPPKTTGK